MTKRHDDVLFATGSITAERLMGAGGKGQTWIPPVSLGSVGKVGLGGVLDILVIGQADGGVKVDDIAVDTAKEENATQFTCTGRGGVGIVTRLDGCAWRPSDIAAMRLALDTPLAWTANAAGTYSTRQRASRRRAMRSRSSQ